MSYGLLSRNDNGVVVAADMKNYVLREVIPAPTPSGNVYTFGVTARTGQIYAVQLPVGGKGGVISEVLSGGAVTVTVLGVSVQSLYVFSPITTGPTSGYGMAVYDGVGACTYDSQQKHFVCDAIQSNFTATSSGDVIVGVAGDIVPTKTISYVDYYMGKESYAGYEFYNCRSTEFGYICDQRLVVRNMYIYYKYKRTDWIVYRTVAERTATGFVSSNVEHMRGWFQEYDSWYYTGFNLSTNPSYPTSVYVGSNGPIQSSGQYPYTQSSHYVGANFCMITRSAYYV
jgi:hypothetical protein